MDSKTQKELLNIVKKNYDQIADHYSETRKKHLWPELIKISQDIKDGDNILDVGCGSGKLLQALEGKKVDYLGIDPCEKLIELAQNQFKDQNPTFRTGNVLELGVVPEYDFDYVFLIAVLHHLPGEKLRIDALKQLKNKITDNGKIILSVWNLWQNEKLNKYIWKFFALKIIGKNKMEFGDVLLDWKDSKGHIISKRYYHAFTKRQLKKAAKKAGLKIEILYKDKFNYYMTLKK